ncbi:origin of replication complex subunit 4 [Rosa rugosa]|uniref:origin of replication complex subunit 4 n=1 Tax=Rosa rugosa TaxID=74645 RepID=UPI002B408547|nr:origin of replication complex subunit 4 [Rosa rugosa]
MGRENPAEKALILLRTRLCDPNFIFRPLCESSDSNYSKLKFLVSSSITEACNNSILLLGPRGSGKIAVLDLVISDLLQEYPDTITVIRLSGLLHSDENCALKEISRQLCTEHQLLFSKMASFDENSQFLIAMLRECGLAHKTIIFVLDEFDLFALGKQRLLYNLLDALQSVTSQAVVIGVSCRLDADQLLEKRVISRFSNRKLLFLPPSKEDIQRLLEHILLLPTDSGLPTDYVVEFNAKLQNILADERFEEIIYTYLNIDSTVKDFLRYLFRAVSNMDLQSGMLSLENFKTALSNIQRHPKMECIKDCSILELYILVCMKRLEVKEHNSYNFTTVMKEYKSVHDSFQTSDYYAKNVCLRAFEHLLQRGLIEFIDNRGQNQSVEYRPVKLLISFHQLHQGLKSYRSCPAILQKIMDREK